MDNLVLLVKFLLVAVYMISEFECDMLSLNQAMCPDYEKAVVYTMVEHVETSDANGNRMYRMIKERTYKEGRNALNVSVGNRITMRLPPQEMVCGHTFPEDINKDYIIAGDVGSDGILSSNMCQYVRPAEEVFKETKNWKILEGRHEASCGRGDS